MLAELVERALDALRPEFAAAFRAHVFDGLGSVAVAARLGIPTGTARTRIHRARRALRSSLAKLVHAERRCSICHERE
jgi:DNA-directed RNA polymerase specialized sigma24 family protein